MTTPAASSRDWIDWTPIHRAVLCFVIDGDQVLLIEKKRGLGAGNVNAPGGKIEPGESPAQAAIRETLEEVHVEPTHLESCGMLRFRFTDGYSLLCEVFIARSHHGTPTETDEAKPFWSPISQIPYDRMWADDREWLPQVLAGQCFSGTFDFDGTRMLTKAVSFLPNTHRTQPNALIAGCGFVGLEIARNLHHLGWDVTACTHSQESAHRLASEPFKIRACDISDPNAVETRLGDLIGTHAVIHCASSGKGGADAYRSVYLNGAKHLNALLVPKLLAYTGSTSVFTQTDGSSVNEESPATPTSETGQLLLETEQYVLAFGGLVIRLGGIYGPGRSVLLRKFLDGSAVIEGDGNRWINQIHHQDAANAMVHAVHNGLRGLFNAVDDHPITQRDLYQHLAQRLNTPLPPEGPINLNRKRGWTHKRIENAKLKATGWQPRFPSFFKALDTDPQLLEKARTHD
jgi:nucleoside-diphosphate-sugar epimerase/8-oxo-dGTP pyrophosphatase MutT (NUDIX family)